MWLVAAGHWRAKLVFIHTPRFPCQFPNVQGSCVEGALLTSSLFPCFLLALSLPAARHPFPHRSALSSNWWRSLPHPLTPRPRRALPSPARPRLADPWRSRRAWRSAAAQALLAGIWQSVGEAKHADPHLRQWSKLALPAALPAHAGGCKAAEQCAAAALCPARRHTRGARARILRRQSGPSCRPAPPLLC